jgi:hypothetical protein
MSLFEKVIEFVTKKLSIEINEENQKLILDEFYPDIEDKIYWYFANYSLYEGIITKDEYSKIKALPQETIINFGSIVKYVEDECELNEIHFTENVNEIKKIYDKGYKTSYTYFDLMDHLNDEGIFEDNEQIFISIDIFQSTFLFVYTYYLHAYILYLSLPLFYNTIL